MAEYKDVESKEEARNKPVVRCKSCVQRFEVPLNVAEVSCPHCGSKWRISWPKPGQAYIRGDA